MSALEDKRFDYKGTCKRRVLQLQLSSVRLDVFSLHWRVRAENFLSVFFLLVLHITQDLSALYTPAALLRPSHRAIYNA